MKDFYAIKQQHISKKIISKYQCGFRNGYSVKYCLIAMIEKWGKNADGVGVFGAILSDLSKAFDCILQEVIIAKLQAYGFHIDSSKT